MFSLLIKLNKAKVPIGSGSGENFPDPVPDPQPWFHINTLPSGSYISLTSIIQQQSPILIFTFNSFLSLNGSTVLVSYHEILFQIFVIEQS